MGDEKTGRPFSRRYALCSCKSISTEVSACNNTDAQKKIATPSTTLILRLNSRAIEKSQPKAYVGLSGMNTKLRISSRQLRPFTTICRRLTHSKSCVRLLISVHLRLYTDDIGIRACTTPIVGP